jgi:lysophospholipase L1-like esterase
MRMLHLTLTGMLVISSASAQARCSPTSCANLVFDGDSISAGGGASPTPDKMPPRMIQKSLPDAVIAYDVAVSGSQVSECLDRFEAHVMPRYNLKAPSNLIVFHAGDNDIGQLRTAPATYEAFTRYVALAHRNGWKVVVSTELPRPDFPAVRESELEDYNRRLLENSAGADAVVDLSADRQLNDAHGRPESGLYTADSIHPNDNGYSRIFYLLSIKIAQMLGTRSKGQEGVQK